MTKADVVRWLNSRRTFVPKMHDHYCMDGDHRWKCMATPCLLHLVVPCTQHAKASLDQQALDKEPPSAILIDSSRANLDR
jgi:hypothetical protein